MDVPLTTSLTGYFLAHVTQARLVNYVFCKQAKAVLALGTFQFLLWPKWCSLGGHLPSHYIDLSSYHLHASHFF